MNGDGQTIGMKDGPAEHLPHLASRNTKFIERRHSESQMYPEKRARYNWT